MCINSIFESKRNNKKKIHMSKTAKSARQSAAEGIVMLKNRNNVLPLKENTKVSVFGRCQIDYNQGGTGSGGSVNVEYTTNILDSLRKKKLIINEDLAAVYEDWVDANPIVTNFEMWAARPLCQKELEVTSEMAEHAASFSDIAIIVIGRTAGEEQDNSDTEGSYRLTAAELKMIKNVSEVFKETIVLLNTSNIIDMKWVDEYKVSSVLYIWQGGQEGGNGVSDIICGEVSPSGRLTDTIAVSYSDYPSAKCFGSREMNLYKEDIYVGYRYFETFASDKVKYPFGYGLSYTNFDVRFGNIKTDDSKISFEVIVKNIGRVSGKEVVQIYCEPPLSKIDTPKIILIDFGKTQELRPNESETLKFNIPVSRLGVYDDLGVISNNFKYSWIICKGEYTITASRNIRDLNESFIYRREHDTVLRHCEQALAPTVKYERIYNNDGKIGYRAVPTRTYDLKSRINDRRPKVINQTGDRGYKLNDVREGKVKISDFAAQISVSDLICMTRGEGMNSKRVRPGTGTAFGGITEGLHNLGIPVAAGTDGPSGLRFDNGDKASSVPIGTMLASTWNCDLVREVYSCIGDEMLDNDIDLLLGPGMNIHRSPLCGRNFEYYSEDPFVSGVMAASAINGLQKCGVDCVLKHFAANHQEKNRKYVDSVVSERALREIYLRAFEYAMEYSRPRALMTAYNPLNGQWCGSNYDLTTTIIRDEYGFDGMIMTDWWAMMNDAGSGFASKSNTAAMLKSQTDIYMVTNDPENNGGGDNTEEQLNNGNLTIAELQRAAINICGLIVNLPAMDREYRDNRTSDSLISKVMRKLIWWKC